MYLLYILYSHISQLWVACNRIPGVKFGKKFFCDNLYHKKKHSKILNILILKIFQVMLI